MLKTFPINFIQQILLQTLYEEHQKNNHYFGGKDQINISSFYEQLRNDDEMDRFVDTYRDLNDQQNRVGLIGNGILLSPENPTITNLYDALIIPMSWTCSIRCTLANRDQMLETLYNMIYKLKGRKIDVAQLECEDTNGGKYYQPWKVGTLGNDDNDTPIIKSGDCIFISGTYGSADITSAINTLVSSKGFTNTLTNGDYLYIYNRIPVSGGYTYRLDLRQLDDSVWNLYSNDNLLPDNFERTNFERFKVSMAFDSFRCDEPRTLNGQEYCVISFGGQATIVNASVKLGNDMVRMSVKKNKIVASSDINLSSSTEYYLEPMEMPSGLNANTQINQLISNNFKQNTHTDGTAGSIQYTFILDESIDILNQWFNYARYGAYGTTTSDISPNMIYDIKEIWSSWGNVDVKSYKGKIVESIDIENTESDTLTLGVTFQIQGANN